MPNQTLDEVLEHYGIKGMRWGVRRTPEQLGRARLRRKQEGKPVTKISEDAARAQESKAKARRSGAQSLSNKELAQLNQRLNLEQQYDRLTAQPKGKSNIRKGHDFVKSAVEMGKTANEVYNLATNSPIAKELKK